MESREGFENGKQVEESPEERNTRMVDGRLTEEDVKFYQDNPDVPIFQHELVVKKEGREQATDFSLKVLTENNKDDLLESVRNVWDTISFAELSETLDLFFEQKKIEHPLMFNVEYYVATDSNNNPFAIVGVCTVDIYGGAGFATRDELDLDKHFLSTRLDWFSVSKEYQGRGIGNFLIDWIEKMAKSRGGRVMSIQTDDYASQQDALRLFKKRGYENGLDIKDYFGPGRDLVNYSAKVELLEKGQEEKAGKEFVSKEKVSEDNKQELLDLGKRIYSLERFEEFIVCLDLFLKQKGGEAIIVPHSFVLRDLDGKMESFSILVSGVYQNAIFSSWEGADPNIAGSKTRLSEAMKNYAISENKGVVIVTREGEDISFLENGFASANDGVPEVFKEGNQTKLLLYSKKL